MAKISPFLNETYKPTHLRSSRSPSTRNMKKEKEKKKRIKNGNVDSRRGCAWGKRIEDNFVHSAQFCYKTVGGPEPATPNYASMVYWLF